MQHIQVICIGKYKERYWEAAEEEYRKRLTPFAKIEVLCLPEAKLGEKASEAEMQAAIEKEGDGILQKIPPRAVCVALCILGKEWTSPQLAEWIKAKANEGAGELCFVIGGSNGLSKRVEERADLKLSFSPMTFPHQLARVMLFEQIYRSYQILSGSKYHK